MGEGVTNHAPGNSGPLAFSPSPQCPLWCYVPAGREGKPGRVVQEAAWIWEERRGRVLDISIVVGGRSW